ncbi:hypothetical protein MHYP_G00335700 [Metynnis hypsauchen]
METCRTINTEWRVAVAERHWQPTVQLVRNMSIKNLQAVGGAKTLGKDARKSDNNAQAQVKGPVPVKETRTAKATEVLLKRLTEMLQDFMETHPSKNEWVEREAIRQEQWWGSLQH